MAALQYDEAIVDLTEAIKIRPDLGYAYCNRGLSYLRKMEPEKALADFEKGLDLRVDMPLCYYGRGEIALSDGNYRAAINDLTRGINFKPTVLALIQRATAYEKLGDIDSALRDYRSALALQPESKEAQAGVVRLSQRSNSNQEIDQ